MEARPYSSSPGDWVHVWPRGRTIGLDFCLLNKPYLKNRASSFPSPSFTHLLFLRFPPLLQSLEFLGYLTGAAMPSPLWPSLHSLCHLLLAANLQASQLLLLVRHLRLNIIHCSAVGLDQSRELTCRLLSPSLLLGAPSRGPQALKQFRDTTVFAKIGLLVLGVLCSWSSSVGMF